MKSEKGKMKTLSWKLRIKSEALGICEAVTLA